MIIKKYVFLKNDMTIKKYYEELCNLLLTIYKTTTTVTRGKHKEVIEVYDCFRVNIPYNLASKQKREYEIKINKICADFGYKTKCWYSLSGLSSVDIIEPSVENMIAVLKKGIELSTCQNKIINMEEINEQHTRRCSLKILNLW